MTEKEVITRYQAGERVFDGMDLALVNLSGATLSRASFVGAALMLANLSNTDLSEADLTNADLRWANLSNARITGQQLGQVADLTGATMPDGLIHA